MNNTMMLDANKILHMVKSEIYIYLIIYPNKMLDGYILASHI